METIIGVAIKSISHGTVMLPRPNRHHHVLKHMSKNNVVSKDIYIDRRVQGFYTNTYRFVNRFEALDIAKKANQILEKTHPTDRLFSEDIWR